MRISKVHPLNLILLLLLFIPISICGIQRPNIVFILSDDQDARMDSLSYMPTLQSELIAKGTHYRKHYCTVALCCPSRVSLWTGKAAHNTNVTDIALPYGGYPKFISQGLNDKWLPVWLQEAGYNTYYTGKLFNAHTILNYDDPYPKGFDESDFLLDPGTYQYYNPIFQHNTEAPIQHNNSYTTDLVANKSLAFLDTAATTYTTTGQPFFLTIAPIAPHAQFNQTLIPNTSTYAITSTEPPVPADRHKDLFAEVIVPRTLNFNPDVQFAADYISLLPKLSEENVTFNDEWYRQRLRALQAVDELIGDVVQKLDEHGLLDNTYVVYSSDNGYHISQHRLPPGKGCGYEEDINVPLIIRGPGVPSNTTIDLATSHTDLAPTFFSLLGIPLRDDFDFDGTPIPVHAADIEEKKSSGTAKEHVQVEYWSARNGAEYSVVYPAVNNTYKGLRVVGEGYGFYYSVWCAGGRQLYDMARDPYQTVNLLDDFGVAANVSSPQSVAIGAAKYGIEKVVDRLDALLMLLKSCKGKACYGPWSKILPGRGVATLEHAMKPDWDWYFATLPKIGYKECKAGYIPEVEGIMWTDQWALSGT